MDWTQVLVILCVIGGDFLFLTFKIDFLRKDLSSKIDSLGKDLTKEIQNIKGELTKEIQKNRDDMRWIKYELGHRPSKEPKEN